MTTEKPAGLTTDEARRARRLMKTVGMAAAAFEIGISRQSLAFALAGLEVRRGTLALVRAWLKAREP